MKVKIQQYEVHPKKVFADGDPLKRKSLIYDFVSLINQLDPPFVLAIDAPWGSGKTTFVKLLRAVLEEKEKIRCIYFNAWETDFTTDPLISFVGELKQLLQSNGGKGREYYNGLIRETGLILGKRAIQATANYVSGGLVDRETYESVTDVLNAKYDHKSVEIMVEAYEEEKDRIDKFRAALETYIDEIADDENKTVVIFVDELDRCRPTYAVELLERMKHFFNIKNVIFVLSLHKEQLGISLGAVYGQGIESDKYLRRFIDLEYRLPLPSAKAFAGYLVQKYEISDEFEKRGAAVELSRFIDIFVFLSELFELDLRTREQCFTRVAAAIIQTDTSQCLTADVIVILTIIRTVSPEVYFRYVSEEGSAQDIFDLLQSKSEIKKLYTNSIVKEIYALLILTKSFEIDPPELCSKEFNHFNDIKSLRSADLEPLFADGVIYCCHEHYGGRVRWDLDYVVKRMDISK